MRPPSIGFHIAFPVDMVDHCSSDKIRTQSLPRWLTSITTSFNSQWPKYTIPQPLNVYNEVILHINEMPPAHTMLVSFIQSKHNTSQSNRKTCAVKESLVDRFLPEGKEAYFIPWPRGPASNCSLTTGMWVLLWMRFALLISEGLDWRKGISTFQKIWLERCV